MAPVQTIDGLISKLGLIPVENGETAFGSLEDTPVTMTVLSVEPLSLLFALNVNQDSTDAEIKPEFAASLPAEMCRITVENGRCWLSLYEVTNLSDEQIAEDVRQVHECLIDANLTVGPGCLRCGSVDDARVMFIEGRTTRICTACLDRAIAEKQEREAQLNKMSVSAVLGLPAAILICAACWAWFWYATDLVLDWLRIEVIEINHLTSIMMMGLFVGIGVAIGIPLGKTLRKAGVVRFAPIPLTCAIVVSSLIIGEIDYIAILIFQRLGIIDFAAAAQLLWPVVANYTGFWIVCKILCAGAIAGFCISEVNTRKAERLDV